MKYTHNYSKLDKEEYTTIRRYSKGKVSDIVREVYPNGSHYARITCLQRLCLVNISTEFLCADTDRHTRIDATTLIQSFYRKPIDPYNERLYIYYLKKVINH